MINLIPTKESCFGSATICYACQEHQAQRPCFCIVEQKHGNECFSILLFIWIEHHISIAFPTTSCMRNCSVSKNNWFANYFCIMIRYNNTILLIIEQSGPKENIQHGKTRLIAISRVLRAISDRRTDRRTDWRTEGPTYRPTECTQLYMLLCPCIHPSIHRSVGRC